MNWNETDEMRSSVANLQIDMYQMQERIGALEESIERLKDAIVEYFEETTACAE